MKTYLGIDPGTTRIGYGIIAEERGDFRPVAWGLITHDRPVASDKAGSVDGLRALIRTHRPVCAGIERLFFMKNQRTAMAVSEMRGVLLLTLQNEGVPVLEFTPQQVKQTVTGHGNASKRQIQDMVRLLLKIPHPVTPDDAADGLALALCCATAKSY